MQAIRVKSSFAKTLTEGENSMGRIFARKQQLSLKFWIQHCRSFNNYTLCMEMAYSDTCADAGSEYICNVEEIKFTVSFRSN